MAHASQGNESQTHTAYVDSEPPNALQRRQPDLSGMHCRGHVPDHNIRSQAHMRMLKSAWQGAVSNSAGKSGAPARLKPGKLRRKASRTKLNAFCKENPLPNLRRVPEK